MVTKVVSKQRQWQLDKEALGLCRQCGQAEVFRLKICRRCYRKALVSRIAHCARELAKLEAE